MLACNEFESEYTKIVSSKKTDINVNAVTCEQDSGFEDLVEYVDKNAEHIAGERSDKPLQMQPKQQEQHITAEAFVKTNLTRNSFKSNSTSIAKEVCLSNKRGVGRPPKRHDNQFKCDLCKFITAYATHFRTHMSEVHQGERVRIFKCIHCTEAYVEERFLREHIKHIHDCIPKRPKFICDECGKGFPKQSHLKRHSYVHNPNEKPFLCEHCPKRFTNQSSLMRHIEGAHATQRPHVCEVCAKAFGHIYGLKAHKIRMH